MSEDKQERQSGMIRRQAEPVRVGQDSGPATGTDTVTVGCAYPNGLHMMLYDVIEEQLVDLGGNKHKSFLSFPRHDAPTYILNGSSVDIDKLRKGKLPSYKIVQGILPGTGFGLTPGVPRAFWEEWSTTVGKPFVQANVVFAAKNDREANAQGKALLSGLRTGLEPLDSDNPGPRTGLGREITKTEDPNAAV